MTKKEYNTIRSAAYAAAEQIPEINAKLNVSGVALVYEITEGQKHEFVVLTAKTQLHDNLLRDHGFTTDAAAKLVLQLDRQTKCATW